MTIWAYGDSFVADYKCLNQFKPMHQERGIKPWVEATAEKLNQTVVNHALQGSSPDYMYHMFRNDRDLIQNNDILIIGITSLSRRWFLKDNPYSTIITDHRVVDDKSDDFRNAVKYYLLYLEHAELYETYCIDFLYNIDNITKEKNLHTIVLPIMYNEFTWLSTYKDKFKHFYWADYPLTHISLEEYDIDFYHKIVDTFICDGKINHLTWSNHKILADKIVDNITNKTPLNIEHGFVKNIITFDTINNQELKLYEFAKDPIYK